MPSELISCPKRRDDESIVAQDVMDEFVIYDLNCNKIHNLNATAASVWQWCDGHTSTTSLSEQLAVQHGLSSEQAQSLLWLTLDRLEEAALLSQKPTSPAFAQTITRRQVMRTIGIAAALPVVYTIVAPTPAAHASHLPQDLCVNGMINGCDGATVHLYSSNDCDGTPSTSNFIIPNNAGGNVCTDAQAPCANGAGSIQILIGSGDCTVGRCVVCP